MKALLLLLLLLFSRDRENIIPAPVPVLCYHNITDAGKKNNFLFISSVQFSRQMQSLYDSGFHSITPDQLHAYLTKGAVLPSKPFMITFDDSHMEHYTIAVPILQQYGFNGAFQLTGKQGEQPGIYNIKRFMIAGSWAGLQLQEEMRINFPGVSP